MSGMRQSSEVIEEFLEDGELPLERMPDAIEALMLELSKPAPQQPSAVQFAQLTQSFAANAVGMLANQVASLHAEIGHLSNVIHNQLSPENGKSGIDPQQAATELRDLMLSSIELDRLRRILDLVYEINRKKIEVAR